MTNVEPLFQPFHSAKLDLANRIVMAPMTRSFSPGGVPGANVADYYARRADAQLGRLGHRRQGALHIGPLSSRRRCAMKTSACSVRMLS